MKKIFSKFLSGLVIFSFSFFSSVSAKGAQEPVTANNINLVKVCDNCSEDIANNVATKDYLKNDFYDRDGLNFIYLDKEEDKEPEINIVKKKNPSNEINPAMVGSDITKKHNSVRNKSFLTAFSVFCTSLILKGTYDYLKNKYFKTVSNDLTFHSKNAVDVTSDNEKTLSTKAEIKDKVIPKKVNESTTDKKETSNLDANEDKKEIEKKETMDSSLNKDVKNEKEENKDSIKDDSISDYKENSGDDLNSEIDNAVNTQDSDKLKVDANEDEGLNINENNDSAFMYSFIKKFSIFLAIILTFEVIGHLLFWWRTKDATAIHLYEKDSDEYKIGFIGYKYKKEIIGFWPFEYTENPTEKEVEGYIKSFDNRYIDRFFWKPLFGFFGVCKNGKKSYIPDPKDISPHNSDLIKGNNNTSIEGNNNASEESPAPMPIISNQ